MFVNQKVQEIAYALIRVAAYMRRQELKQRIERLTFQLLEEASSGNFEGALKAAASLEGLLKMAVSIYELESTNAKVILGEIASLNSAMRQIAGLDELPNIDSLFKRTEEHIAESNNQSNGTNGNGMNSTLRQSAILDRIRQSENRQAQLRDILAAFPDISERTMRYDLQKLCFQRLLERVGNGGPGSYYLVK